MHGSSSNDYIRSFRLYCVLVLVVILGVAAFVVYQMRSSGNEVVQQVTPQPNVQTESVKKGRPEGPAEDKFEAIDVETSNLPTRTVKGEPDLSVPAVDSGILLKEEDVSVPETTSTQQETVNSKAADVPPEAKATGHAVKTASKKAQSTKEQTASASGKKATSSAKTEKKENSQQLLEEVRRKKEELKKQLGLE